MPPGGAQPLKTMLGPTRGSKLPKIELSLLNCSWARFWALHGASQDTLGSLLAPLGALLGALGTGLERSGMLLGHSAAAPGDQLVDWPLLGEVLVLQGLSGLPPELLWATFQSQNPPDPPPL